jgi:peptidyl-prolyl cis-trans isomerase C
MQIILDMARAGVVDCIIRDTRPMNQEEILKRFLLSIFMLVLLAATLVACGGENAAQSTATPTAPVESVPMSTPGQSTAGQDEHIAVQHILIGFKDAIGFQGQAPPKAAPRTQEDARKLAYDLLSRAKAGEDFDKLVVEFTDDSPPGIYSLANNGVAPASQNEYPRNQMVAAFGDVGFGLKLGEIGIADYDPNTSPFGYHIIKRVTPPPPPTPEPKPAGQDDRITVQHILIGFKDAIGFQGQAPPKAAIRTQEEAKTLAYDLLNRVKAGEDFDKLVTEFTDDSPPGIYSLANIGVQPQGAGEYERRGMVSAFGDVGFALKVGEIGIADYEPTTSPFGYHIIKRTK